MGIDVGVSLYPYPMTAYYTAVSRCKITKKSATKQLTVPAYLFISIDFGLVRALYMPDKLNLSNMWEGEKKNPSGVIFFERTRFSYLTDL